MTGERAGMIERVARAICQRDLGVVGWNTAPSDDELRAYVDHHWPEFEDDAIMVITEMREPSSEMTSRAWTLIGSNLRYDEVYRLMIEAALANRPACKEERSRASHDARLAEPPAATLT